MKITKTHYMSALVALVFLLIVAQTEYIDYFTGREKLFD